MTGIEHSPAGRHKAVLGAGHPATSSREDHTMTTTTQSEREARARMTYHLTHPEDPAVILGTLDYWSSDGARAVYTDGERLAAVDAVMAQHRAARAEQ